MRRHPSCLYGKNPGTEPSHHDSILNIPGLKIKRCAASSDLIFHGLGSFSTAMRGLLVSCKYEFHRSPAIPTLLKCSTDIDGYYQSSFHVKHSVSIGFSILNSKFSVLSLFIKDSVHMSHENNRLFCASRIPRTYKSVSIFFLLDYFYLDSTLFHLCRQHSTHFIRPPFVGSSTVDVHNSFPQRNHLRLVFIQKTTDNLSLVPHVHSPLSMN